MILKDCGVVEEVGWKGEDVWAGMGGMKEREGAGRWKVLVLLIADSALNRAPRDSFW
jgi:hypothetical protein